MLVLYDPLVAEIMSGCTFEGRSFCEWSCRLHHLYIELRSAWHDAGGLDGDIPLRLTAMGEIPTQRFPKE